MSKPEEVLTVDGGYGEGGGQILRTSLALAAITGQPVRLINIRANRKNPGLRSQHLSAVQACTQVCGSEVAGVRLGARDFTFRPGPVRAGSYILSIGTAGAVTLVLQTILPALAHAPGDSVTVISGGTHVPWSPPFHYLERVFVPMIGRLGFPCEASLARWGWYPRGGGEIQATIKTATPAAMLGLDQPFELECIEGISASSRLPEHIRVRQKKQLQKRLKAAGIEARIAVLDVPALDAGSFVFICAQGKESIAGFSSLGARGKPAERVADEAARDLFDFLDSGSAVDFHLADQILIYLALVPGTQRITTSAVTRHLLTNVWVIEQFLPVRFEVVGGLHRPGLVIKRDR
ncbi:MAG: RNA 3'-terminal phosphate cyclase [Syntrophobacteria bacterium]